MQTSYKSIVICRKCVSGHQQDLELGLREVKSGATRNEQTEAEAVKSRPSKSKTKDKFSASKSTIVSKNSLHLGRKTMCTRRSLSRRSGHDPLDASFATLTTRILAGQQRENT
jgi:hypothetical protein